MALKFASPSSWRLPSRVAQTTGRLDGLGWTLSLVGISGLCLLGLLVALAPWLVILLGATLLMLAALGVGMAFFTAGAPLWTRLCALVVIGQLVLNYGFATAVLPLGPIPLPLSELVLAVALICCAHHIFLTREPVRLPIIIWLVGLWVPLNLLLHLPNGVTTHGLAAARDALPTLEVSFLIPGYVCAVLLMRQPDGGTKFLQRTLSALVIGSAIYGLGYAIENSLLRYSPRLPSIQQSVPLLGSFRSWPMMGLFAMIAFSLWRWQSRAPMTIGAWLCGLLVFASGAYTFFATQSRAAYLIVGAFLLILMLLGGQGKRVLMILGAVLVASLVLLLAETLGLELKGRVSTLSSTQILDHLLTLSGDSRVSEFQGAAGGIAQRRAWIEYSLGLWQRDIGSMVFGIGFGDALTDHTVVGFQGQTILVREPHNSYISVLTRSGAIGLGINLALQGIVLMACVSMYRRNFRTDRSMAALALGALFLHFCCAMTALGQPVLESPYFAVPLHFMLGAVYALHVSQKAKALPHRASTHTDV